MRLSPIVTRSLLWGFRLFHLTPLAALILLPVGKWPAVVIAFLWPVWMLGVLFFEMAVLQKWLGPILPLGADHLRRDAEAGNADAQYRLARTYVSNDDGVFSNASDGSYHGIFWYRKAAAQGHLDAAFALAETLMQGDVLADDGGELLYVHDVPPDPDDPIARYRRQRMINSATLARDEALKNYRIAAAQGHTIAQGRLGEMYRIGNTVSKNNVTAHMWLSLALAGKPEPVDDKTGRDNSNGPKRRSKPSCELQAIETEAMRADHYAFSMALAHLNAIMTKAQTERAQIKRAEFERT